MLLVSSALELVQAAVDCGEAGDACRGKLAFAVALGAVSIFFVILYMACGGSIQNSPLLLALFLFVWWTAGACVCTFTAPYISSGNGYFGVWVSWACSFELLQRQLREFQSFVNRFESLGRALALLLAGSSVELGAAIAICENGCRTYVAYAVAVGAVSLFTVLLLILVVELRPYHWHTAVFLCIWWIAGAFVNTFLGPFQFTGNGYFASWASLGGAALLLGG